MRAGGGREAKDVLGVCVCLELGAVCGCTAGVFCPLLPCTYSVAIEGPPFCLWAHAPGGAGAPGSLPVRLMQCSWGCGLLPVVSLCVKATQSHSPLNSNLRAPVSSPGAWRWCGNTRLAWRL